jgi:hypothetical protein
MLARLRLAHQLDLIVLPSTINFYELKLNWEILLFTPVGMPYISENNQILMIIKKALRTESFFVKHTYNNHKMPKKLIG